MSGVLNLLYILELVNDASSSEHDLVHEWKELVLHVPPNVRDELGALTPQCGKQILGDVASVTKEFTLSFAWQALSLSQCCYLEYSQE